MVIIFDRIWKNQKKLAVSLNDVILTGLQQGRTVTEIAIGLHNRMGQGFNECHRLVRTESMHYLNDAALRRYKDAGVEYVQVWAALDERTCDTCGGYHEKIYPIYKCPHVPLHANCRCTVLPVVELNEKDSAETIARESDFGIIKSRRFNTMDDPMREVTGEAETSNPKEVYRIIQELKKAGVEIIRRENAMGYSPSVASGKPGQLYIEEGASYSAWCHEFKHFSDDRDDGYLGFRVFQDIQKCKQREIDAYQIEIELARKANRDDIVKRLEELRDKEVAKYERNSI